MERAMFIRDGSLVGGVFLIFFLKRALAWLD